MLLIPIHDAVCSGENKRTFMLITFSLWYYYLHIHRLLLIDSVSCRFSFLFWLFLLFCPPLLVLLGLSYFVSFYPICFLLSLPLRPLVSDNQISLQDPGIYNQITHGYSNCFLSCFPSSCPFQLFKPYFMLMTVIWPCHEPGRWFIG